jgi:RES domain
MQEGVPPTTCSMPADGVWRIGRGNDPLAIRLPEPDTLATTTTGNRFDSPEAAYGVLYFATDLRGCCGETLSRFRPSPAAELVKEEWRERHFMEVGGVSQEWRQRRTAVRVQVVDPNWRFLDVETSATVQHLRRVLALGLSALGLDDLDISDVRGRDRRITRLISSWAFHATDDEGAVRFGGIRYKSRLDSDWECWAVFHDVELIAVETRPLLKATPELQEVARLYGLTIH